MKALVVGKELKEVLEAWGYEDLELIAGDIDKVLRGEIFIGYCDLIILESTTLRRLQPRRLEALKKLWPTVKIFICEQGWPILRTELFARGFELLYDEKFRTVEDLIEFLRRQTKCPGQG